MSNIADASDDELNCILAPLSSRGFYETSVNVVIQSSAERDENARPLRRSTRPTKAKPVPKDEGPKQKQYRKRTLSMSATQNDAKDTEVTVKKAKLEGQKAATAASHVKRDACESARKIWLHHHQHLFKPLLPSSSSFNTHFGSSVDKHASFTPLHEFDQQPSLIRGGVMKDYQLLGLSFLAYMYHNGMNCILGDEMGLGKTLQTLALFAYIRESSTTSLDPHLVICPLSVLSSWEAEAARWLPSMRTLRLHGTVPERTRIKDLVKNNLQTFDILLTTYETYVAEDSWFKMRRWTYCVLDEGHKIKNTDTNVAHKLQGLGSIYRLLITGTPLQNNLAELWALLHWLYPLIFTPASERLFRDSFDLTKGSYSMDTLNAAKALLGTIMLRRTKATVEMSVPPREELTVFVPMTEAQRFWTYRLLTRMDAPDFKQVFGGEYAEAVKPEVKAEADSLSAHNHGRNEVIQLLVNQSASKQGGNNKWTKLMNLLLQLRKVCDHPYLLPGAEPEPYYLGEHLIASSSKLMVIDKLLADILPKGDRVLIFSDFMAFRKIPYARLDGSTARPRRTLDIRLVRSDTPTYKVFLVSTKAGGLGINLTKATHVIMCDSDWNPQNDLQAIARAHRIGQTKTVKVYRLICRGSVEDQMLDRLRRKLFLSVKVMGSDNPSSSTSGPSLGSSELIDILRKGSSVLASSSGEEGMDLARFTAADINTILDSSRSSEQLRVVKMKHELGEEAVEGDTMKKEEEVNEDQLLKDAEEEERRLLSGVAQVSARLFDGQVVKRHDNKGIANEWQELQKRARNDRSVWIGGIPFLVQPAEEQSVSAPPVVKKQKKKKHESEDYCIHCHDGGELVCCDACPRVFHSACAGIRSKNVTGAMQCAQHECAHCHRKAAMAGGMLFRCRTCADAYCEDCLPEDEILAIGDTLPEFEILNCSFATSAYFIQCPDCQTFFKEKPEEWTWWQEHFAKAERQLKLRE
ncbi:hypothetical protein EYR40_010078 [Pleurotus pulmonarius]|nr:hypothetical protein EYR40_010078 [Pleurotus pulmonarius]